MFNIDWQYCSLRISQGKKEPTSTFIYCADGRCSTQENKTFGTWNNSALRSENGCIHRKIDNSSEYLEVIQHLKRGCPRGVIVKAMDCGIVVSEFELQSRHYVHFRPNTLGKGMNPLILPAMG